jgi:polyphosphate kinase
MPKLLSEQITNRELSWLEFNQRVLDEATDETIPLLERLKFLAITASNLDEFFMVRVGGLQLLRNRRRTKRDPSGMTPAQQLKAIRQRTLRMVQDQYACLLDQLEPGLANAGIQRLDAEQVTASQQHVLEGLFESEVFPVLTPMAVGDGRPFPLLINRSISVLVRLAPAPEQDQPRWAIVPLGPAPKRFYRLPGDTGFCYTLLEDIVTRFMDRFFAGETIEEICPFRITRNADMSVREDMAADLMAGMTEVLDARRESDCVRLEVRDGISRVALDFLKQALDVRTEDVYHARGPLDLSGMMWLAGIGGFDALKYEAWDPQPSPDVDLTGSMFDVLRERNVMLSLPYERFDPVIRLIDEAADDADVLAIKIILYRTSRKSPIVAALRRAAERGKHVTAIVELKARFDEARNIEWAKALEQVGVQVIYGVKGLKTHAKVCIIVRRETHGIQRYVHFSTGNYNEATARLYSDICYLTCNEELAEDAVQFFNAITGYSQPQPYTKLAAAPYSLRDRLLELIDGEIDRKRQGQRAHIMAQLNSLADPKLITALYRASRAGVRIDLNVRGVFCLKPGVPKLSQNIRAVSILDRYLEHSRIIYFHHGGDELVFISSADWMPRNLDRRVELLVPIEDSAIRKRLIGILKSFRRDNLKGRLLLADGGYERLQPTPGERPRRHQQMLHQAALAAQNKLQQSQRTIFKPHRAAGTED